MVDTYAQTYAAQHFPFATVRAKMPRARAYHYRFTGAPNCPLPPSVTGALANGSVLTCSPGGWNGSPAPTFAYAWKSGGSAVGTNSATYTTVAGDVGKTVTCTVTGTNTGGSAVSTSNPVGPVT